MVKAYRIIFETIDLAEPKKNLTARNIVRKEALKANEYIRLCFKSL